MFAIFAHTLRTLWLEISFLDEQNINAKLAMKSHKGSQQRASQKKRNRAAVPLLEKFIDTN